MLAPSKQTQVTGRALKVGDVVRGARMSPKVDGTDRPLESMLGIVLAVFPKGHGKVRVHWASNAINTHDACMIVKVDEPFELKPQG